MTLLILDEQLAASEVLAPLRRRHKVQRLPELRSHQRILDDRVSEILLTLKQPTFVSIDHFFWRRRLCNPGYCILYFALPDDRQELIPTLVHDVLRHPEFRTRTRRMGKVARVGLSVFEYWQFPGHELRRIQWQQNR